VESGESGADAAAREIEEETGWRPTGELRHILTFQPMVGMVDSPHDLFIGYSSGMAQSVPENRALTPKKQRASHGYR
jgi:8-oxo-dGTP pyrophosphatase MutT (NUDIX family)